MEGEGKEDSSMSLAERVAQRPNNSQRQEPQPQKRGPLSFLAKVWGKVGGKIEQTAVSFDRAGVDPNRIIPPATGVYPRNEQTSQTETSAPDPSKS